MHHTVAVVIIGGHRPNSLSCSDSRCHHIEARPSHLIVDPPEAAQTVKLNRVRSPAALLVLLAGQPVIGHFTTPNGSVTVILRSPAVWYSEAKLVLPRGRLIDRTVPSGSSVTVHCRTHR